MSSTRAPLGGIARAAALITLGNLLSRLLGLVRESVIASLFGKTVITSAFTTAATVPTMLYDLIVGGAVSAALIPVFAQYAAWEDEKSAADLGKAVGSIAALVFSLLAAASALLVIFAPLLVQILGVAPADEAFGLTVNLVRIVLPSVVLLGLSSVLTALLYARQQFVYPAFAVACYNLGIVGGALTLAPRLGPTGLAIGVLIGAGLQLGLQVAGLRHTGLRFSVDFRHPAVRRVITLYAPVALGLVVTQLGVILERNLAWRTGEDSLAIMRFAGTLVQLPLGLIAAAVSLAILPRLASASEDEAGLASYNSTLALGLRFVLLGIIPVSAALISLREPVVRLIFERQAFDAIATRQTAEAFLFYSPQLPFAAVDQLLIFAFYARKNTLTPMLVGVVGIGIYVTAGLLLIGPFALGVRGLALANAIQNSLHAVILAYLLRRAVGPGAGRGVGRAIWRTALAAAPGTAVCLAAQGVLASTHGLVLLLGLAVTVGVAGLLFAAGLMLLKSEEAREVVGLVRSRIGR